MIVDCGQECFYTDSNVVAVSVEEVGRRRVDLRDNRIKRRNTMDRHMKWLLLVFGLIELALGWIILAPPVAGILLKEWHLWTVQSVTGLTLWTPKESTQFTLRLTNSWAYVYGLAGCNSYSGEYQLNNASIRFQVKADASRMPVCIVPIGQDPQDCLRFLGYRRPPETVQLFEVEVPMVCPDAASREHEDEFLRALNTTTKYDRTGDELRVYFDDGRKALVFSMADR